MRCSGCRDRMATNSQKTFSHLLYSNSCILIQMPLKFIPNGLINDMPASVQKLAGCGTGEVPLSETVFAYFTAPLGFDELLWSSVHIWYLISLRVSGNKSFQTRLGGLWPEGRGAGLGREAGWGSEFFPFKNGELEVFPATPNHTGHTLLHDPIFSKQYLVYQITTIQCPDLQYLSLLIKKSTLNNHHFTVLPLLAMRF